MTTAALGGLPAALASSLKNFHDQGQRRQALKEAMALSAQKLLSGPEDHVGELRTLLALATNQDMQVWDGCVDMQVWTCKADMQVWTGVCGHVGVDTQVLWTGGCGHQVWVSGLRV